MVSLWQEPSSELQTLTSHHVLTWRRAERGSKLSRDSYKVTNPIHEGPTLMTLTNPNYLPKAPSPNTITSGSRVSTYEFGGDTSIQSVTRKQTLIRSHRGKMTRATHASEASV